jgi:hypothetical protein
MTQADSVYITPPTNTSAIDHSMMFPPCDPTRRRFLAVAAVASAVSSGTLAAATMAPNVPQAVTVPIGPDPIYDVIEAHRKAALDPNEAERVQFAFDHGGKTGERREEYERLVALTDVTWAAVTEAGCTLVNTRPTTLAGILASAGTSNRCSARPISLTCQTISITKTTHRPISPKRSPM